jgi:tetratricopeptide (TPR) repeat protein
MPMLPLLALPFGAKVAPTPEADAIDPEFRRLKIHDVIVDFLDATLDGPILLVVEDAHWIDDASGELTNHLVRAGADRPWAGIITRRPEGPWTIPEAEHVVSLHLEPLDDEAIRQLAIDVSTRALADRDLDLVAERAQGNPLFAVELARALSEATDRSGDLPDTIEQIIATRFDRLDPSARRLIRVASVLGNQFHEAIVGALLSAVDHKADVAAALAAAMEAGAIAPRPGSRWSFNHALYRDTAYEGLPFRQRQQLHLLAAEIIEERAADTNAVAPLLSLHYSAAREHEQAWRYSLKAAEIAESQNATAEAATALARAVAAGRYSRTVTAQERAGIAEHLGDRYYTLGSFKDAEASFRSARRHTQSPIDEARLMRKIGSVRERQGAPSSAINWYRRSMASVPPATDDPLWLSERAVVALAEAGIRSRQGDNAACRRLAHNALADAEVSGNHEAVALALERIHLAQVFLREPDIERTGPRAAEAHRELGDFVGLARTLTNMGIEAYFAGRWDDASKLYLDALEAANRAGSVVPAATAAINSAEVLSDQGHWDQALELFGSANRNYEAVGYLPGVAATTLFSAVAMMRSGNLDVAGSRLDAARQLLGTLQMPEWLDDLACRQVELELLSGRVPVSESRALIDRFDTSHPFRARALRVHGLALIASGEQTIGLEALRAALDADPSAGFERALTLRAVALATPGSSDANAALNEAETICRTLGVRRPPPLLARELEGSTSGLERDQHAVPAAGR